MSDYFIEDVERLPFSVEVKLLESELPRLIAVMLTAWLRFRAAIGMPYRAQYATRWRPQFIKRSREEMPGRAMSRWAPLIERLEDQGFEICGWSRSETIGTKDEANVFLLDEQGTTLATVLWMQIGMPDVIEQTQVSLTSYRPDGTEVMTAALPVSQHILAEPMTPDYVALQCLPDSTDVKEQYRLHCDRSDMECLISFSSDTIFGHYEQQMIRLFDHIRGAGLLRNLSQQEVDDLLFRYPKDSLTHR